MNIPPFAAVSEAIILLTPVAGAADPVVSNISAAQRGGTKLVDITYDVTADKPQCQAPRFGFGLANLGSRKKDI